MSAAAQELFELKSIAKCSKIRLSAVSQAIERQLVALVLSSGDLVLYHSLRENEVPQLRWIPWFEEASKDVQCLTFDPLSGAWLLLACFDGSLQIVPIFSLFGQRTPPEAGLNNWSRDDVTSVHYGNTANLSAAELCPTAVTWWVRQSPDVDRTTRDIAIVGTKGGHVIFVSLLSGTVVGSTTVDGAVAMLNVCRSDDSLSEETTIILLVTGLNQQQWKVILEHRETGTYWPFMADSKLNESSISSGSYEPDELHSRLSFPSFPAARTRLQGLKQLSVEKLTSLRQKITDSRSRGLAGGPSLKRKNSSSSEDSLSRYRLPVDGCSDGGLAASNSPRILSMANIQLSAQHLHKRTFLTSYYSPVNIVTVYCTSVDMNPVSVHKLCVPCGSLLLCDHLFYVKSADGKKLTIISTRLSECHANSEKHLFNSDVPLESMLQEFEMKNDEFIVNLHRIPAIPSSANDKSLDGRKSHRNKKGKSSCSHMEVNCKDLCAVVTNMALYIVKMRAVHEEVLACVKDVGRMEEGERLARIFGLDLQKLLELAADQQLDAGMLESGISLYTLSKCRPLKSVLRLAAAGYTVHMLQHILALLKAVELSPSEQLHLSNLCLLSYTEQILRSKPPDRNNLTNSFKEFLSENSQYDEALAVNIIAQSGLCRILTHLSNNRGLHTLVADILARLLTHINDQAHRIDLELADGFWECLSERLLCESHLVNADVARTHIDFVKHKLPLLTETILERLAFGYDPSRPALRPVINRFVKEMSSTSDSKLNGMTIDIVQSPDSLFPFGEWLTLYLLTCVYLAHARALTLDLLSPLLSDYDDHASSHDKPLFPNSPTVPLPLPVLETPFVKPPILNAGFTHAALVRNKQLIMWGQTANGCLGSGPNLNKTANPSVIGLFPQLSLSVIGVACGRFHTLALTENGVYSWGSSKYGQLGVGKVMQSSQPRLIDTLANRRVVSVECGQYHSMALTDDGKLYTWGWGVHGQLGHGSVEDHHYPTLIQNLSNEMCVSCSGGHAHSLALTSSGRVWAFGSSVFGQLGTGNNVKSSRPVQVYGLPEKIVMISTAYFHNLGLAASNRLYTWGSSPQVLRLQAQAQKRARARAQHMQQQQQQEGAATVSAVQIQEPTASVAANDSTAVPAQQQPALGGTNAAVATPTPPGTLNLQPAEEGGEDSDGKMSRPHFKMAPTSRFVTMNSEMVVSPSTEMKALPAGRNVNDISTTPSSFSIENGPVSNPVVGLDDALAHLSPTLVDTSHVEGRITMISCGCHHSALLTDNGRVHTWGRNLDGQLGNGARTKEALHPTQINIGDPVEAELQYVVCGGEFTLGMEANGKVWAWGSNMHGQLGRTPVEDSTKAGMVLLKTSKRIIKLPHGSLNSADSPTEITGLPPFELYDSGVTAHKLYLNGATPLAEMENPPHGLRTLHYALHHYKGYYDTKEILNKCLELEDWCTASKLLALDGHLDRALRYRLKAVAAAAEVTATANASSVSTPLNKTSSSTMTTTTEGTTEEEEEEEDEDEVEEEVTADTATATSTTEATDCSEQTEEETSSSSSSRTVTTTRKAVEGVVEAMAAGSGGTLMKLAGGGRQVRRIHEPRQCQTCNNVVLATIDDSSSSMDEVATSADENSANEIHTFAVQGGTEEMSSCSQDSDTAKTSDTPSLSDDVFESRSETPPSDSNTATAAGPASFSCCQDGGSQPNRGRLSAALVQQTSCDSSATECRLSDEGSSPAAAEKAYTTAIDSYTRVVAAYLKAYADRPLPVLRDLLYQALDFWIEQSLPVSTLENFLREHWDLVHYPLGVLLFGNEPKSSDAEKILCRLSTDFSLLLCSSMVEHVSDKKKPCPEMVEMLAGLSWNGGMDTDCGSEMADPEARLSRVLEDLYNPQELQPFIDISFPVGEESCNGLTPSEVIAFSCGHRYEGVASLHKAAGGVAHTLDHRNSLPATAHALLRIFQQPQLVRHFACPQCILGCIETEMQ